MLNTVMNCVQHGACYYLVKPSPIVELKILWIHVFSMRIKCYIRTSGEAESG